jgi:hypothetical protein
MHEPGACRRRREWNDVGDPPAIRRRRGRTSDVSRHRAPKTSNRFFKNREVEMAVRRKNLLIVVAYVLASLILAALLVVEFSQDRYQACMSIGAFSKSQCEEYAAE